MKKHRFGMVIDLDRCTGCGACMLACAVENNVPPAAEDATENTGIAWMRVSKLSDGGEYPDADVANIPMMCQQCEHEAPCVTVCPQNAVEVDPDTGIVGQVPQRCLGCRYCMAACPYHARAFNWHDPRWEEGSDRLLNPDVSPRMRGVAEKCNFCHGRLHSAMEKAAAGGRDDIDPADYTPACEAACPERAIVFGDLDDAASPVALAAAAPEAFRFLPRLGTEPKVFYRSGRRWIREMAGRPLNNRRGDHHAA
jgi:menaquinone reductase, iron-sulfur cluster-binding subunit